MANSTIGALPAAALPLAGTSQYAVFEGGTTKRVPKQDSIRSLDTAFIKDDFQIGLTSSSSIGELRWININTTIIQQPSEVGHPGIIRASSSVSSGVTLQSGGIRLDQLIFSELFDIVFIVRANGTLANSTNRFGLFLSTAAPTNNPPTDGIYFERLSTDANWFGVVRAGSAQTRVDTTVAATTSFVRLRIRRIDSGTIGFTVGGAAEANNTATEPAGACFVTTQMFPVSGTQTMDIDYFDLLVTGLTR